MKRLILIGLGVLALSGLVTSTRAANVYVGAGVLSTDTDLERSTGWEAFIGWDIIRFVGLEASYKDLGSFSSATARLDTSVIEGAGRGIIPIGKFELFVKLGYANVDSSGYDQTKPNPFFSETNWEVSYGAGAAYNFKYFGVRLKWEGYNTDESLDSIGLSAYLRF